MTLLSIEDLTITLPFGQAARPILDRVSITVEEGETVGLVGESGSGKSVTSRAALGLFPAGAATAGTIRVADQTVLDSTVGYRMDKAGLRRMRGGMAAMVFQDPRASVNPLHRVGDFLTEAMRTNRGLTRREAESRAAELLESVGITDPGGALRRWPHEFSGGMLQRVVIAAALAADPRLLLADEPTTALDVSTQAEVIAILARLRRERGMGMLFVTHDLDLAGAICDRIYVLYAGQVMETQPTQGLFRTPRHPYTAALLGSRPHLDGPAIRLDAISGLPLSLDQAVPGCPFAPRCERVTPDCEQDRVPLTTHDGAEVACLRAQEVSR
ncbi:ABC transporter ATP-binding protein [Streptomyces sp. NPDC057565]|uniref:ABC transporter ATP-binding protein n=1 Tax=Streptomyces sp. NPDC057565 TaxID=3346169 RepID=UPI003688C4BB